MHLKSKGQRGMENEVESDKIFCPVCNKYLQKEESLHEHLNSHPKQDVIEALIQLKDAYKDHNSSGPALGKSSSTSSESSSSSGVQANSEMVVSPIVSIEHSDEPVPGDLQAAVEESNRAETPYPSSSHIVPYPQFLARAAPVAHFIHVPVVTSAVSNVVTPTPSQASLMLYSHFMCPESSQPASTSASDVLDSPRHVQILTNSNLIRTPYSIIQARSQASPVTVPQSQIKVKTEGSSGHIVFMPSVQGGQQPGEDVQRGTTEEHDTQTEGCETQTFYIDSPENKDGRENSQQEFGLTEEDSCDHETDQENGPNADTTEDQGMVLPEHSEYQASQEKELLSPPKKRRCPVWNEAGSPGSHSSWNALGSPGAHSTSSVEGVLRVRSDLSVSPGISPPSPEVLEKSEVIAIVPLENIKKERVLLHGGMSDIQAGAQEALCKPMERNCDVIVSGSSLTARAGSHDDIASETLNHMVPISDVSCPKEVDFHDDCSLGQPDSAPLSPYQKSLDSPSTPLNIQTDETMPPRGELSEQESLGGNSSSMWSVPAYHTFREWPSPVVSYDLTTRESWPGSDMSDSEGNANAVDSHQSKGCTPAPSFSNTLQPFIKKYPSDGESPFSSHLQSQNHLESHEGNKNPCINAVADGAIVPSRNTPNATSVRKAPAKPRVYRCKECSVAFSTLKLRRLHPCEQMKNSNDSTSITVMRVNSDIIGVNSANISASASSSQNEEISAPLKPKRKYTRKPKTAIKKEVIVDEQSSGQANFGDQYQISKTEPDDTSELRNSQTLMKIPAPVEYQNTTYNPTSTERTFVEVVLKHESLPATYQCEKCGQYFKTAQIRSRHMSAKHKESKPHKCDTCGESFEKERGYLDHLMIHPLECQQCGKTFMRQKNLARHLKWHVDAKPHKCETCGESFEKESGYLDHLMIHPLECQQCGKTFTRRKYLTRHMKWHLELKPHKCETCSKSFVTKQKLNEHLNTHTGNAPIKCSLCDKTFKRYSNLIQHKNTHHLNVKRKVRDYVCHCGVVLTSKKKLEWHKEIHDVKPKSCQYCNMKFVHSVSLTRHVRKAHDRRYVPQKERERENIECPVCHLVFLKASLATHLKIHSGERPFPCHICGKDFTTKWNLQHHRWVHASRSSKPFKCTLCKATFYRKEDIVTHMHSHRNVRPYTCNHCGCQFVRRYNCIRHMREHEEDKNFACTICNKTFHRNYYLTEHMRVHTDTRPFICHICGKASISKSNHNRHVRIHHAKEPQNTEI